MYCFDGLVQDCSNSIANALVLLQFCTKPSVFYFMLSNLETHVDVSIELQISHSSES